MDTNDPREDADKADQSDDDTTVDLPSATIIGTNLMGINAAPFPGGIAADAAELAATEATDENDPLQKGQKGTGDEGVSTAQSELEADELDG
jgi:hypothetical protein